MLRTARLILVPADARLAAADVESADALAVLLDAVPPAEWPPPLMDDVGDYFAKRLAAHPDEAGWWMWYWLRTRDAGEMPLLIGAGGFKGPPWRDGTVEIGYSLLRAHQSLGYATEAVGALVRHAFDSGFVRRVIAETFSHLPRSIRLLEKHGFSRVDEATHEPGAIRYALPRSDAMEVRSR